MNVDYLSKQFYFLAGPSMFCYFLGCYLLELESYCNGGCKLQRYFVGFLNLFVARSCNEPDNEDFSL